MAETDDTISISNDADIEADALVDLITGQRYSPAGDIFTITVPAYTGILLKLE